MSIKQIAEKAGTSVATVSRVLNHPEYRCKEEGLREKIWKCAMELNYVPNEAAKNLKCGRCVVDQKTYRVQILMTRSDGNFDDPFFSELLRLIRSEIHRNQCILTNVWFAAAFSNENRSEDRRIAETLTGMKEAMENPGDGLVIIGKCAPHALKQLKNVFQNIVSVNRNSTNYEVDEVICDGKKIARLAVEYLISLGHESIAYVGECDREARYKGYTKALSEHDLTIDPRFIADIHQSEQEGYRAMEEFLQKEDKPTAFYCANDITAIGMIKCLNHHRNRLYQPSIISSDNIEEGQFTTPMLSTVNLPKEQMARFAVQLLLDRISGGHENVVRMELEGNLIRRSSCARVEESYITEYYI